MTKSSKATPLAEAMARLAADLQHAQERAAALERELGNKEYDVRALETRVLLAERRPSAAPGVTPAAPAPCDRCEALQAEIDTLRSSSSWRITRPIRAVLSLVRRG